MLMTAMMGWAIEKQGENDVGKDQNSHFSSTLILGKFSPFLPQQSFRSPWGVEWTHRKGKTFFPIFSLFWGKFVFSSSRRKKFLLFFCVFVRITFSFLGNTQMEGNGLRGAIKLKPLRGSVIQRFFSWSLTENKEYSLILCFLHFLHWAINDVRTFSFPWDIFLSFLPSGMFFIVRKNAEEKGRVNELSLVIKRKMFSVRRKSFFFLFFGSILSHLLLLEFFLLSFFWGLIYHCRMG